MKQDFDMQWSFLCIVAALAVCWAFAHIAEFWL